MPKINPDYDAYYTLGVRLEVELLEVDINNLTAQQEAEGEVLTTTRINTAGIEESITSYWWRIFCWKDFPTLGESSPDQVEVTTLCDNYHRNITGLGGASDVPEFTGNLSKAYADRIRYMKDQERRWGLFYGSIGCGYIWDNASFGCSVIGAGVGDNLEFMIFLKTNSPERQVFYMTDLDVNAIATDEADEYQLNISPSLAQGRAFYYSTTAVSIPLENDILDLIAYTELPYDRIIEATSGNTITVVEVDTTDSFINGSNATFYVRGVGQTTIA